MTGGPGESLSKILLPWGECLFFAGIGENRLAESFPCFCNDDPCKAKDAGRSFRLSFRLLDDCDVTAIDVDVWAGFLASGCKVLRSWSDALDFEPVAEHNIDNNSLQANVEK